jgi:hypothetical protein
MPNITSQIKVKRALGIPAGVTMHDTYIEELLWVADQQIISYCGMAGITSTTVTETYDISGRGENVLVLQGFPVSAVSSILVSGGTITSSSYYLESRTGTIRLKNAGSYWPEGRQKVKVSYTFGYSSTPADLTHAATIITCQHFNSTGHAGFLQEAAGGYRYKMDSYSMPPTAVAILARYRRVFPKGDYQ